MATAKKAAAKKAAAKTDKVPRAKREVKHGVPRPHPGGKCAIVWDIADKITAKQNGKHAEASQVLAEAEKKGLNANNVRCEFQAWRKFNGLSGRAKKAPAAPKKAAAKKSADKPAKKAAKKAAAKPAAKAAPAAPGTSAAPPPPGA